MMIVVRHGRVIVLASEPVAIRIRHEKFGNFATFQLSIPDTISVYYVRIFSDSTMCCRLSRSDLTSPDQVPEISTEPFAMIRLSEHGGDGNISCWICSEFG